MNRLTWKFLLIGAVVAAALSTEATQANAQWLGWYRPVAWSCCYAPHYYSPCTVSCNTCGDWGLYLGWRPGPIRRLLLGRYRWYWGPTGWTCGTTYESCCSDGATYGAPAPAAQPNSAPTPAKKPVIGAPSPSEPTPAVPEPTLQKSSKNSSETSGTVAVWVPGDAKVTINGRETQSTGSRRQFVSHGLKLGYSYKYVIRAEVVRDGQVVVDTRTVVLTAGQTTSVAFGFNANTTAGLAMAQ